MSARAEHLESLERGLRVLELFNSNGTHALTMSDASVVLLTADIGTFPPTPINFLVAPRRRHGTRPDPECWQTSGWRPPAPVTPAPMKAPP